MAQNGPNLNQIFDFKLWLKSFSIKVFFLFLLFWTDKQNRYWSKLKSKWIYPKKKRLKREPRGKANSCCFYFFFFSFFFSFYLLPGDLNDKEIESNATNEAVMWVFVIRWLFAVDFDIIPNKKKKIIMKFEIFAGFFFFHNIFMVFGHFIFPIKFYCREREDETK